MNQHDLMNAKQDRLARTVLEMAGEIEADEERIKAAILSAAQSGDSATVARIVRRWMDRPVREVATWLSSRLDRDSTSQRCE